MKKTAPISLISSLSKEIFAGDGEMAQLMRELDWSKTELGSIENWTQSLRSTISICINSRFPFALYWGPHFNLIYNDAWRTIPSTKHPLCLGQKAIEVWPEVWATIGPLFQGVFDAGEAVFFEDSLLPLHRSGYMEECYFSFNLSPAKGGNGKVDGIVNIVVETTYRVINERRTKFLRELSVKIGGCKTADEVCRVACAQIESNAFDVPFAAIYLFEGENTECRLSHLAGITRENPGFLSIAKLATEEGFKATTPRLVDLTKCDPIVAAAWPEPVKEALVLPILVAGQNGSPAAVLIAGVSPRRALDENYRAFFEIMASQISSALASAHAYEIERGRAESLRDLDLAKTTFFGNVSHEFRTPLTLILGPLEDLLSGSKGSLPETMRPDVEAMQRNSLRLLKLVNTLLDLSRMEGHRVESRFVPTNLSSFTSDIAASFHSVIIKAGLKLNLDCSNLNEPVYVDRDMWEKIVLNLVSNAFKYTFHGSISVTVTLEGSSVILKVIDTGTGIPKAELPKIFDRFHRVSGAKSRSFEGTGIGLSLVRELVEFHHGTIRIESEENIGTRVTIEIPRGSSHLGSGSIFPEQTENSRSDYGKSFLLEAERWLSSASTQLEQGVLPAMDSFPISIKNERKARILLAEDNRDMREYVSRLLLKNWEVECVEDGAIALRSAKANPPDLVLADVMMPNLDGLGLLRGLRADQNTKGIPIILLSGRAGDEGKIEGYREGADDYLVKPFSARELIARVQGSLALAALRNEKDADLIEKSEELARSNVDLEQFAYVASHDLKEPLRTITNNCRAIEEKYRDKMNPEDREYLDLAISGAARMELLVDGLLEYSKVNSGSENLELIEMERLAREISENFGIRIKEVGAEITWDHFPSVLGNRFHFSQLLQNLIGNALKFSSEKASPRIHIGLLKQAIGNIYFVKDNGIGIEPKYFDRIFMMFQRLHGREKYSGTGIGLALCKKIVEKYNGKIWVESSPGMGTTFYFTIGDPIVEKNNAFKEAV